MANIIKKVGFLINPISGMGGTVGLKGTDSKEILKKAIELGAKPNATNRAKEFLTELESIKSKLTFITCPGIMGESILKTTNFNHEIINHPIFNKNLGIYDTTAEHTMKAVEIMKDMEDLKIIIFVGGDGTAKNIESVVNEEKPCLGIPSGVKIYSSVFALNPRMASSIVMQYLWDEIPLRESEVLDINEEAYRNGKLVSMVYGHLLTPYNPEYIQTSKIGTIDSDFNNQERIAKRIVELLENDIYYLIGPGTTTKAITDILHQKKTVLGVDLLINKKVVAQDLNEQQILEQTEGKNVKIIVSLIGGQGFLFGRGNLQFTPNVLRKIGSENIIIISTRFKLQSIPSQILRLDTRDVKLDNIMKGFYKVIVDYDEIKICKVE